MELRTPTKTVLYSIEEAIKSYRRFSQKNISRLIPGITVDQVLILIIISDEKELTQMEIADRVFKDYASITRIINLMVINGYLVKEDHKQDRRRSMLQVTSKGKSVIKTLGPVIEHNRRTALAGLGEEEIMQLYTTLKKITANCSPKD